MGTDNDEFLRRCQEDKARIEALGKQPMSLEDEERLGVMVARQMLEEQMLAEKKPVKKSKYRR